MVSPTAKGLAVVASQSLPAQPILTMWMLLRTIVWFGALCEEV